MLPSASDLQYFLEVVQTGNISRAAERLGITQPSLSLSIKRLEEVLGGQLLVRTKTGVHATHLGLKFHRQSRQLLDQWERIRAEALSTENEIKGNFTIGCHPSVAIYSLPHFLPKLLVEAPELEFSLRHNLSRKITEDVTSFQIDFGLVVNPVQHPDLVIRELFKDEVTLWKCAKASSLQKEGGVLIFDPNLLQSQALLKKVKRGSLKFDREIHSANLEVISSLVACGAGIGLLPTRVAQQVKGVKLVHAYSNPPTFLDRICLVYRADSPKTAAHQHIVKVIEKTLKFMG
ncbi:MAG: LysR family transcriptional regulator [Bdellovibrionaceae bacterium]|nr:LysR family transcriptional regulator [Bdellovibrionales bacterium]MCB9084160.1 LysR family transcriptional regulator [Pseudobdellovibrionaceae bacterium]